MNSLIRLISDAAKWVDSRFGSGSSLNLWATRKLTLTRFGAVWRLGTLAGNLFFLFVILAD
jgi:hypothetical protein